MTCFRKVVISDDIHIWQIWQARFEYGGLVLGLSQFSLVSPLPQKMTLNFKMV